MHQIEILRGSQNAAGAVDMVTTTARTVTSDVALAHPVTMPQASLQRTDGNSSDGAATTIAVGVALDAEGGALPPFLGSGMTLEHHRPCTSAVDLEGLGFEADGLADVFFEGYTELYHRVPRFYYPAEAVPPSDMAMRIAHDEYAALTATANVACRARRCNDDVGASNESTQSPHQYDAPDTTRRQWQFSDAMRKLG